MKTVFAIAPWEYPGADFAPNPHAFTRRAFAGKERELWLKMRQGVIYFGEVEHSRVFAVTRLFDDAIAIDAERLIAAWRSEVERENYGAFLVIRQRFSRSFAVGNFCVILRADGSGWIKEHFDEAWEKLSSAGISNAWEYNSDRDARDLALKQMQTRFIERTVEEKHFQSIAPHWSHGTGEEMMKTIRIATLLWLSPKKREGWRVTPIRWICKSMNVALHGYIFSEFNRGYSYVENLQIVRDLAAWHYGFVGVEWKRMSDSPELQDQLTKKIRNRWKRGLDQWDEDWRGNWFSKQYDLTLEDNPLSVPSQHERLEAALFMREFLADKLPAEQIESMLRDALQN